MDRTLKSLSVLLAYPTAEAQAALPEIGAALAGDDRLTAQARGHLQALVAELAAGDLYALEEAYVTLFDRTRALSLNLFEHVHGESRDRGSAMVALMETYGEAGLAPATMELPDHLPVVLEFLATRPEAEARAILADAAPILEVLQARLERRENAFAAAFAAILQIARARPDRGAVAEMLAQPDDDPADLAALDAAWEESEVQFGPDPNGGCPQVRDMLANMDRPERHAPPPPSRRHAAE